MSGDDLNGADLNGADLSGADLNGAELSGTDLNEADLSGTELNGELGQTDVKKFQIHLIGHIDQCIKRLFG